MSKRRTPVPIKLIESRAIAMIAAAKDRPTGLHELQIRHDSWCMAQRAPGKWCNCDPEVWTVPMPDDEKESAKRFQEIVAQEKRRVGLLRHEEN